MTATEILDRFKELGVSVRLDGDKVRVAPVSQVPGDLMKEARQHKSEIIQELSGDREKLLARLRDGQLWLLDQHQRWQASDPTAASDAEFSRTWAGWWRFS